MADKGWKAFQAEMKRKRAGTRAGKGKDDKNCKEELTVQRLSSEVAGKQQKYSRIGPREFVDFSGRELTIANIKEACTRHFASKIGVGMVCDILAGEQGPSCSTVKQIPDTKLIHVRFIDETEVEIEGRSGDTQDTHREQTMNRKQGGAASKVTQSLPSPNKMAKIENAKSKFIPKSLSVSSILNLGRVVKSSTTLVNLNTFHLDNMVWSTVDIPVEFQISNDLLGQGGFRKAYRAKSNTREFSNTEWVVKKYKTNALKEIENINQTAEQHTRKVVQMHNLSRNFAAQLTQVVLDEDLRDVFGETFTYKNIYLGKLPDGEFVTVEEFVEGEMEKLINNDGKPCGNKEDVMLQKAECLVHFSYEKSDYQVMLVDVQGVGYELFDPEIASAELVDSQNEVLFTTGNLSATAIQNFKVNHTCNFYCKCLALKPLSS